MLEEALRNPKSSPAEIATAMLSFIRVDLASGGGAASEQRFFRMYPFLCERIFGKILEDDDASYAHQAGGWFSAQSPWGRSASSSRSNTLGGSSSGSSGHIGQSPLSPSQSLSRGGSLEKDPVVELLGVSQSSSRSDSPQQPTLIEILTNESEYRPFAGLNFPFKALPEPTQAIWLALIDSALGNRQSAERLCSANDRRLLTELLKHGANQPNLRNYHLKTNSQKQQQHRQPLQLSPLKAQSPNNMNNTPDKASSQPGPANPSVVFSMLEHYLFTFIRFPLASKPNSNESVRVSSMGFHSGENYGEKIYSYLFGRYLWHFLPYFTRQTQGSFGKNVHEKDSELFLRIIVTLWFESSVPNPVPTATLAQTIKSRRQNSMVSDIDDFDLDSSFDLVQVKFQPMGRNVKKLVDDLIIHVICDPHVEEYALNGKGLTHFMEILQPPLYNLIRAALRYTSIHDSKSSFFHALDLWLKWIEPWNVSVSKMTSLSPQKKTGSSQQRLRTLTIPRPTAESRYDRRWEGFIASNVYMYAVPLAIFLRRARELDFSSNKFNPSVRLVQRVFRVFSPDVVEAIDNNLGLSGGFVAQINRHRYLLDKHAPPSGHPSMSSLGHDATGLLEEVYAQHYKNIRSQDIFDAIGSKIEGFFGHGVVSGEEKSLKDLLERAKVIARLPVDFQVDDSVRTSKSSAKKEAVHTLKRERDGSLSETAKKDVLIGKARCDPLEVSFVGDRAQARPGTYELPFLIDAMNSLSISIEKKSGIRLRLRFFADYRNFCFTLLLVYLGWKLIF